MVSLLVSFLQLEESRFQLFLLLSLGLHLLYAHLVGGCPWDIIEGSFLDGRFVGITQGLRLEGTLLHGLILLFLPDQLHRCHRILLLVWLFRHESALLVDGGFEVILFLLGVAVALVGVRLPHQSLGDKVDFWLESALPVDLLLYLLDLRSPLDDGLGMHSHNPRAVGLSLPLGLNQQVGEFVYLGNEGQSFTFLDGLHFLLQLDGLSLLSF